MTGPREEAKLREGDAADDGSVDEDSAGVYFVSVDDFEWRPDPNPDPPPASDEAAGGEPPSEGS